MTLMRRAFLALALLLTLRASASDSLQWSGFALLRASSTPERVPFDDHAVSAQVQLGIDWDPSLNLGGHLHVIARNDDDGGRHARFGIVEAYLEQKFYPRDDKIRIMEGAFFLPTSRENIDALWESPYTISSSALNSWMGEEFRPIGIDAAYTWHHAITIGATAFTGNDTFGALPAGRGWMLRDHWAILGEHLPAGFGNYSSVSAETDHRIGWSARARWNNDFALVQLTHIDNRADALQHGELYNWATRFDIAGASLTLKDWTVAAEDGWGPTVIDVHGTKYTDNLVAKYLLVSRRMGNHRVSIRGDAFQVESHKHALTAAWLWSPPGPWRTAVEVMTSGGDQKISAELRYNFAGH